MLDGIEYIIIGDTEEFNDCLISVCGKDKDNAESILNRMKNNPTDNDRNLCKGHTNLRIKEVKSKDCWWNYNCD